MRSRSPARCIRIDGDGVTLVDVMRTKAGTRLVPSSPLELEPGDRLTWEGIAVSRDERTPVTRAG